MIKLQNLKIENLENAGCNNGNYPTWEAVNASTGEKISGITCNCRMGCAGTDRLVAVDGVDYLDPDA